MKRTVFPILILLLLIACNGLTQPTPAPLPTATTKPTDTPLPTETSFPTETATQVPTATPDLPCDIQEGEWGSAETSEGLYQLLVFRVSKCKITTVEIWAFPAPGELFWFQQETNIDITNDGFQFANDDPYGEFTMEGQFDSPTSAQGTINFPKGYLVVDYVLPEDVSIDWTASPKK